MQRKAFIALRDARWVTLFPDHDLEVELVPSEMPDLTTQKILGVSSDSVAKDICANAFKNFKGYADDEGNPIPNSFDTRMELYSFPVVRKAIQNSLEVCNLEVVAGEGFAASD